MNAKNAAAAMIALATSLLLAPLVGGICLRFGIVDRPGPLKIHTRPIPRLGGIAIALALLAGMTVAGTSIVRSWAILASFAIVWLTGLIDDLHSLPPLARLTAQVASAFLLWRAGFRVPVGGNALVNFLCACGLVVLFVNALNFLDGSDGLAAGVTAIAALAFLLAAPPTSEVPDSCLAPALFGACAGFLLFNLPPARTFMGDSGSTLLGFALAFLSLDFYRSQAPSLRVTLFPVFVAALPLLDAALAIIRRLRLRRSLFQGDRAHMYDLALTRGYSPRQVALATFAFTLISSFLAWLALRTAQIAFLVADALLGAALLAVAVRLGAIHRETIPQTTTTRRTSQSVVVRSRG